MPLDDVAALLAALLLLLAPAQGGGFEEAFYPAQSAGNRGADVKAIQLLLNERGAGLAVDGVFGPATDAAARAFQEAEGIGVDGIVGPVTWSRLVVELREGDQGDAVRALQLQLNAKAGESLAVDGAFGPATRAALERFQAHAGISPRGHAAAPTWESLVWHYDLPDFGLAGVCDYSTSNGPAANWGTGAAVGQVEAAGQRVLASHGAHAAVGDIGFEHGGDIPGHNSHEVGLDADIRPVRTDRGECGTGCTWKLACYDQAATLALCKALRSTAPGHVRYVLFNDPVVIEQCPATQYPYHDDHLHVRYCERVHPNSSYAC